MLKAFTIYNFRKYLRDIQTREKHTYYMTGFGMISLTGVKLQLRPKKSQILPHQIHGKIFNRFAQLLINNKSIIKITFNETLHFHCQKIQCGCWLTANRIETLYSFSQLFFYPNSNIIKNILEFEGPKCTLQKKTNH